MMQKIVIGILSLVLVLLVIANVVPKDSESSSEAQTTPQADETSSDVSSENSGQLETTTVVGATTSPEKTQNTNVSDAETPQTMHMTIATSKGDIKIELFGNLAPKTVENFTKLAKDGFYDGTRFHRVIDGFMIQGGDPTSKDVTQKELWGRGGPGYTFEDEIHAENKNVIGTLSMANAGPNTNGSQFFINVADNTFLDTKHTVFGRVTEGMDVVTAITKVETEGPDRPVDDIIITGISYEIAS